jgi:hypothetical protein
MMKHGIRVSLVEPSDLFVFLQDVTKVSLGSLPEKGHHALELILIEHWYIGLATPAPKRFH